MSFDGLIIRKKVFLESSNRIETNIAIAVEVLEAKSSVAFEFCIDEDFMEYLVR